MKKARSVFTNGLITGMLLQLAIGPVFFYIINLALQRSLWDGLIAVLAVTLVDYLYITLSILGIGKLLEKKKIKKLFGIISSIILIIFGAIILKGLTAQNTSAIIEGNNRDLLSSFLSVFILTISSPMTIVFFTSLFTSKAVEYNYTKKDLRTFGSATGLATFLFMGISVLLFSLLKGTVPALLIKILNGIVACLLVGYGGVRLLKSLKRP